MLDDIKSKILAKRRIEKLSSVLHNDDVIYTIVNDVGLYVKEQCILPSDFDFNAFEKELIKIVGSTLSNSEVKSNHA